MFTSFLVNRDVYEVIALIHHTFSWIAEVGWPWLLNVWFETWRGGAYHSVDVFIRKPGILFVLCVFFYYYYYYYFIIYIYIYIYTKNACLQRKCCQVLLIFSLWTVLWLLKISFGEITCCFRIYVSSFASAMGPDYSCWHKDSGTFRFYLSCENLQTWKEIKFGAVECCRQNCTLVSANPQVIWKIQESVKWQIPSHPKMCHVAM